VLSRIPFGFFEDAMRKFFKQFGDITRLRLARNPKVGAWAFSDGRRQLWEALTGSVYD